MKLVLNSALIKGGTGWWKSDENSTADEGRELHPTVVGEAPTLTATSGARKCWRCIS